MRLKLACLSVLLLAVGVWGQASGRIEPVFVFAAFGWGGVFLYRSIRWRAPRAKVIELFRRRRARKRRYSLDPPELRGRN